jgi:hypothetical protein
VTYFMALELNIKSLKGKTAMKVEVKLSDLWDNSLFFYCVHVQAHVARIFMLFSRFPSSYTKERYAYMHTTCVLYLCVSVYLLHSSQNIN